MNIQSCRNTSDAVPLYLPQGLYLKPIAKIHMSVQLPNIKSGKSVSNWEVMEKMRFMIQPEKFTVLKVTNSSMEFIRLEGEIEDRGKMDKVLARLDGRQLKLTNISDNLRIRAVEAKDEFPSRHSWDSFFRDAKNMNETKPGERPDTIHISNLPIRWFVHKNFVNDENVKPSERIFCKVFERFGQIRNVDIPICDPYRHLMKSHMSGMQTFNFDQELYFEGYVQFEEYMGFVKAMDALRGMKLLLKEDHESYTVSLKVDFDKNKHLSDACIRRRKIVRDRFIAKDKEKEELARKEQEQEEKKKEMERQVVLEAEKAKEEQRRQREEQRKMKQLELLKKKETEEISHKIALEEKKLMITQRKLESIRLLEELFNRIKIHHKKVGSSEDTNKDKGDDKKKSKKDEKMLRDKIVSKYKMTHEKQLQEQKEKIKKMEGSNILKAVLKQTEEASATTSSRRSMSMTSLSSEQSDNDSKKKKSKKKKKKSKKKKNKDSSDSDDEEDSDRMPMGADLPPNLAAPWFGYGAHNGMFPFPGQFFPPPMMGRGGYFNRPLNPMNPMMMGRGMNRGSYPRRRGFNPHWRGGRGRGNQNPHQNYYNTADDEYTRYFKRISGTMDDRDRSYSRSYSRSRSRSRSRRSYSRSRSRSRYRSRSRRSRSRSRSSHSRSRSRKSRSRSHSRSSSRSRSRHTPRSRSRSHRRSRSRRSRSSSKRAPKSRQRSTSSHKNNTEKGSLEFIPHQVKSSKEIQRSVMEKLSERLDENQTRSDKNGSKRSTQSSIDSSEFISPNRLRNKRSRSRSWSLPKKGSKRSSWSKSPSPVKL